MNVTEDEWDMVPPQSNTRAELKSARISDFRAVVFGERPMRRGHLTVRGRVSGTLFRGVIE
jgi:hypothetical protein